MRTQTVFIRGFFAITLVFVAVAKINAQGAAAGTEGVSGPVIMNGLNTTALGGLIGMLKDDPAALPVG